MRAALHAHGEDAEGRAELYRLRSALEATGNVKAAVDRLSPQRSLVSVVLACYKPLCLDSHDTVARWLMGERAANAVFRCTRSRRGKVVTMLIWLALVVSFSAVLFGRLDARVGLAVLALNFFVISLQSSVLFLFPLVRLTLRSFDFWYLGINLALIAVGTYVIVENHMTALMVALVLVTLGPYVLLGDCLVRRSHFTALGYTACLLMSIMGIACVFFRLLPLREVTIRVLGNTVSVSDRVYSSGITFAIFVAGFLYNSLRYPNQLVISTGLRCVKMRRATAREFCRVFSLQDRLVSIAYDAARRGVVAPMPQSLRALSDAANVALREAGGEDAAARQLLLRALDELIDESEHRRRGTMELQGELLERWGALSGEEDAFERVLLPAFLPIVVDSRRTVAMALGGARLDALCYSACGSPLFVGLTLLVLPANYVAFLALFSAREPGAPLIAVAFAVQTVAVVLNSLNVLLLNTELMGQIVLRSFDMFWLLCNMLLVAVTGFFLFKDNMRCVVWLVVHVQVSTYFWQDAAPASRRGRRVIAIVLAGYALSQCFAVFAMWTHIFDATDYQLVVFDVPISAQSWCIAGQANVAVLATRFAIRALSDKRNLIFSLGLIRIMLPEAEARELKTVMMAERLLDTSKPQARPPCSPPHPPAVRERGPW